MDTKTIPQDTFADFKSLKSLYLHGMELQTLPTRLIPTGTVILNQLDLRENDWDCKCKMRWMPDYMRWAEINKKMELSVQSINGCVTSWIRHSGPTNSRTLPRLSFYRNDFRINSSWASAPERNEECLVFHFRSSTPSIANSFTVKTWPPYPLPLGLLDTMSWASTTRTIRPCFRDVWSVSSIRIYGYKAAWDRVWFAS